MMLTGGGASSALMATTDESVFTWLEVPDVADLWGSSLDNATYSGPTVSASGGSGSYTYQWLVFSGSASFTSETAANTVILSNTNTPAVVYCRVTDAVSAATANSNNVSVS